VKNLRICKVFSTFAAQSVKQQKINDMNTLLKNLGAILVLLGVVCLAVYYFGVQVNALLVVSMILEVAGVLSYIFINSRLK
jgi:hypothetical protein